VKRVLLGITIVLSASGMFVYGEDEFKHLSESSDLSADTVLKRKCNNIDTPWPFNLPLESACDDINSAFNRLDDILNNYKSRKSVDQTQKEVEDARDQLQKEIKALKQNHKYSGAFIFRHESQIMCDKELKYVQEYVEKRHPEKDIKDVLQRVLNGE